MIELIQTYWLYFLIGQYPNGPLGGLALTLLLASLGLLLAFPLGLLLGLARISEHRALRWPVTALVFVVRGIPLLMVVFWAYFFLPAVTGHKTDQFTTMLIALVVFDGVYLAEIVRAGIQAVDPGQTEAASALGMSRGKTLRRIVLPQAMRVIVPPTGNETIAMLKDTSLLIAVPVTSELNFQLRAIGSRTFQIIPMAVASILWYLALTSLLMVGQYFLEKRFSRGFGARETRAQRAAREAESVGSEH